MKVILILKNNKSIQFASRRLELEKEKDRGILDDLLGWSHYSGQYFKVCFPHSLNKRKECKVRMCRLSHLEQDTARVIIIRCHWSAIDRRISSML